MLSETPSHYSFLHLGVLLAQSCMSDVWDADLPAVLCVIPVAELIGDVFV